MYLDLISPADDGDGKPFAYPAQLGTTSLINEIEALRMFLLDVAGYYSDAMRMKDDQKKFETKIALQNRFVELTKVLSNVCKIESQITDSATFHIALRRVVDDCVSELREDDFPQLDKLKQVIEDKLQINREGEYGTGRLPCGQSFDAIIIGMDDSVPEFIEDTQKQIFDQASEFLDDS